MSNSKIAVSYLRVSTTRQMNAGSDVDAEGNSIATQREANAAKARKLGAVIETEFVEPGASAQSIEKRPVFKQLLAYLDEHPDVSIVIIYMRSRAFRNLADAVITKRSLERIGVKLVSAKEDFGEGIMADAMEAVTDIINEVQVRMNGEDIRNKMRHKAKMGGTNGRAPIGYKNVRIEHDGRQVNSVAIDPERGPLIRTLFETYSLGDHSLATLHTMVLDMDLMAHPRRGQPAKPLSISQLHRLLRDPYYMGLVTYMGETHQGRHEPLVDPALFHRVQEILDKRSPQGTRDRVLLHYLKGLLYCGRCHANGRRSRLVYTEAKGKGGIYGYFLCMGRQRKVCDLPYLPADVVEWHVAEHYGSVGLSDEFIDFIRRSLDEAAAEIQANVHTMHASYKKQLKKLAAQEERLVDLAADGAMPTKLIQKRLRDIQVKRSSAQAGLDTSTVALERGSGYIQKYLSLLAEPYEQYSRASDDFRRTMNDVSFEAIWIDDDGVVSDEKAPVIEDLHAISRAWRTATDLDELGLRLPKTKVALPKEDHLLPEDHLLENLFEAGSSKRHLVLPVGVEPTL